MDWQIVDRLAVFYIAFDVLHFRRRDLLDQPIEERKKCLAGRGPWNELLCTIWPSNERVYWPPILGFDDRFIPIQRLHGRWRLGTERKVF